MPGAPATSGTQRHPSAHRARPVGQRGAVTVRTTAVARPARREDAAAIARIDNEGIEDRIATFETEPRCTADNERMLDERVGHYPAIVCERDGQVVVWPSGGGHRARPCYETILEHSMYVDRGQCGTGAWRVALHRKVGFRKVGVYRRHGRLTTASSSRSCLARPPSRDRRAFTSVGHCSTRSDPGREPTFEVGDVRVAKLT